jgi:hypothetical protein
MTCNANASCDISGSHGGEYEDDRHLGYCTIILMMEAVHTSETLVNFYETTWRNIPKGASCSNVIVEF